MKFKVFILFFLMMLAFPSFSRAAGGGTYRHVLDNGMVVLVSEMPQSPTVAIYALVKTGSATEGKYLGMGVSHFVEHMLFKGTKKRAVGVIPAEVKSLGGTINASTSYDYTIYTLDVPSASFVQGFDIIADMIMNSKFDPSEVNKEREVIFGEMRMINDRPEHKLGDLVSSIVYLRHPYRHPIIGYIPLFGKISQDQLVEYYKSHYIPNNIVLSIAGNVRDKDAMSLVAQTFKDFEQQSYVDRHLPQEPEQISFRRVERGYPSKITRFSMAYQGVSIFNSDMYALDVLANILGQGDSSRLYLDVYKKKNLVNTIGVSNYTPADQGVFEINAEFELGEVDQIIAAIQKNIDLVKRNGVRPDELDKARHQILSSIIFGRQTAASEAYNTAVNEAILGDYAFEDKYLEHIRKLSVKDIQRVAQKYLIDDHLSVVVLRPEEQVQQKIKDDQEVAESEIKKEEFSNGVKVLLKEDHRLPIATIFLAIRAGSREEPEEQSGLNQLTADLWPQGTGSLSSQQVAQMVDARGAVLSSSGGYNSMSLHIDFLSEDLTFALDLMEALVKKPRFASEDFANQQKQEIANVKEQDDSIKQTGITNVRQLLFVRHPLKMDISGTVKGLENITRAQVVEFYQKFLTADHMVISLFGDFNSVSASAELKKRFGNLPKHSVKLSQFHEDLPKELREKLLTMDKQQAAVIVAMRAPDIYDPDRYGMEVISSILGSSLSGRMFVKIREELGSAYTLGAGYSPSLDAGMIVLYVLTTDAQVDRVKGILSREVQSLINVPVGKVELDATKSNLNGQFDRQTHTINPLAGMTGLDELYGLGYNEYKSYKSRIDNINADDIQQIAGKYLDPAHASIVVIRPKNMEKK